MLSEPRVTLDMYLDGEAHRPFAYRVLVPTVIRELDNITPSFVSSQLDQIATKLEASTSVAAGITNKNPRAILWLGLILTVSLVGYVVAGHRLYSELFPGSASLACLGTLQLAIIVPFLGQKLGHVYDFTVLFFMMMLLLAMRLGNRPLYIAVFALACLNKETAILAVFAYGAVYWGKIPFRRWIFDISCQLLVFAITYGMARWIFRDNPGAGMTPWLSDQLPYYRDHIGRFFVFAALGVWLVFRLPECPSFLRRAAVAMIAPQVVLVLLGAKPGEVRNLYEILPIVSIVVMRDVEIAICRLRYRLDAAKS
ncbi:hypothetical protein [Hyphomicrobium facile]|uniref:Uncharacterized protein n=1 Tax=Hyphomicrobium facile TaxID=51670 RepID=A0A1I7NFK2_9HYPH|nr:hypothetical protein [Hyphomicrobium facile]SFV33383.1 hypothetical protein SAMN04488557_1958 [Hyphomicrobium facile]